jgi:ParB family transcriptional regulator, chromosome partitioning protein
MAGTQAEGAKHTDCFSCPPESLVVETNKTSIFYDEGVEQPVPEALIRSVMKHGVIKPVVVVRDGPRFVVDDGRKRQRAAVEANLRLVAAGKPPHPISYILKRSKDGDAGIIGLSAAANLHFADPPSLKAKKAQRMLEAGASREDVALDFGVTPQCVENWLVLLDVADPLLKAVDQGALSESAARDLAKLDRQKQAETYEQMVQEGTLKGAEAKRAVSAARKGKAVPKKGSAKRMKNRTWLQEFCDRIEVRKSGLKRLTGDEFLTFVRFILGDKKAAPDLPDDVMEVVKEMDETKQKPGRSKKQREAA